MKKKIHEHRFYDIVLVVAQGNLGAAEAGGGLKKSFSPVPGTPEAGNVLAVLALQYVYFLDMIIDFKLFEISG
jgi:hypothetical protein